MRILQVHNRYRSAGGEDVVVRTEAQVLESAGHTVLQSVYDNPGEPGRTLAALATAPWNSAAQVQVWRDVRQAQADIIHVHNTWFALSPAVFAALDAVGVPLVATLHNYRALCVNASLFRDGAPCTDCVGTSPWHGVRHRCYHGSAPVSAAAAATSWLHQRLGTWTRHPDRLVVLSEAAKRVFVDGGFPDERMVVKPNCIADPGTVREAPPDACDTVLYVGRLEEQKGVRTLVDAWRRAAVPALVLEIIGEGHLRSELEQLGDPSIRLRGRLAQADVHKVMARARAVVVPSEWSEPFGMVAVEAMACGAPVLVSDAGALPELVAPLGVAPVAAGSVPAWTNALDSFLFSPKLNELGRAGRSVYEQHYSPVTQLRSLLAVYSDAADLRTQR